MNSIFCWTSRILVSFRISIISNEFSPIYKHGNDDFSIYFQIADDIRHKMRKDYQNAYAEMKKFTKRIDVMGIEERAIHSEVQNLEIICANDPKLLIAKLGPLRKKVFANLRQSEKMGFQEKKLKTSFTRKVKKVSFSIKLDNKRDSKKWSNRRLAEFCQIQIFACPFIRIFTQSRILNPHFKIRRFQSSLISKLVDFSA